MRLFVLDESRLLAWTVTHLSPPGTEVVGLRSFEDARRALAEDAPDAFVISVTSPHLPWRQFCDLCAHQEPPVPVLCGSPVFASAEEAGLDQASGAALFLHTPAPVEDVAEVIGRLLRVARDSTARSARVSSTAVRAESQS